MSNRRETESPSTAKLGDVCAVLDAALDPQKNPDEEFAHYSIPAFDNGRGPVMELGREIHSSKLELHNGSVLFSKLNPRIPRVWHVQDDITARRICSTEFLVLQPDAAVVNPVYLTWMLQTPVFMHAVRSRVQAATKSRERVPDDVVLSTPIPLPPLPEQKRIAAKLDEQMATLARAQAALAAQREAVIALRSAVLRTALDPATHPDWQFSKVGNVCDVVNGVGFPEYMQGRTDLPYPFVKVSDMNADGAEVIVSSARNTVDEAILATLGGHAYPMGTVIFPKVGGALLTNKKRILGQPSCFDNNVMGLVPHGVDSRFLYMWFQSVDLRTLSNTQALPSVRQSVVAALEMPLPSRAEQRRIAECLDSSLKRVDAIVASLSSQAATIDSLRTSLLDAAFGGKV